MGYVPIAGALFIQKHCRDDPRLIDTSRGHS